MRLRYALTGRYPGTVETPAYFVAGESVTNAIKHAGFSRRVLAIVRYLQD